MGYIEKFEISIDILFKNVSASTATSPAAVFPEETL